MKDIDEYIQELKWEIETLKEEIQILKNIISVKDEEIRGLGKRIGECEVNYQLIDHMETEIVRLKSKFSKIEDIMIAYFREDARTGLEDIRGIVREALRGLS